MKSFATQTHYEVLEISVGANAADVKSAFDRLSNLYAEDQVALYGLVDAATGAALHQRLKEAFEVLSDEARREAYDAKIGLPPRVAPTPKAARAEPVAAWSGGYTFVSTPAQPAPPAYTWVVPAPRVEPPPAREPESQAPQLALPLPSAPVVRTIEPRASAPQHIEAPIAAEAPAVVEAPRMSPPAVVAAPSASVQAVASPVASAPAVVEAPRVSVPAPSAPAIVEALAMPPPALVPAPSAPAPAVVSPAASAPVVVEAPRMSPPAPSAPVHAVAPPAASAPVAVEAPRMSPPPPTAPVHAVAPPAASAPVAVEAPTMSPPAPSAPVHAVAPPAASAPVVVESPRMSPPAPVIAEPPPEPEVPAFAPINDESAITITRTREYKAEPRPKPYEIPEGVEINGDLLRQVRMARGITLAQLSDRMRVSVRHLENVEGDRYGQLPAGVYLRGILMNLARELGLDGLRVSRSYLTFVDANRSKG